MANRVAPFCSPIWPPFPRRPPSSSPSGCRSSVAVTWRPILRAASCLRVFVVKRENQKVTRQTPTQASQPNNVRKCPVLSGPTELSVKIDASLDTLTTCAQNPSRPDRTSTRHHPAQPSDPHARLLSWCVRRPSACRGMLGRYSGRACLGKAANLFHPDFRPVSDPPQP